MVGEVTSTEVAVAATQDKAERLAARFQRDAFNWQRYAVEDGVRPGTFSVVLIDTDTVRPNVQRAGFRDDLRERVSMRSLMRADNAKTAGYKLIG